MHVASFNHYYLLFLFRGACVALVSSVKCLVNNFTIFIYSPTFQPFTSAPPYPYPQPHTYTISLSLSLMPLCLMSHFHLCTWDVKHIGHSDPADLDLDLDVR